MSLRAALWTHPSLSTMRARSEQRSKDPLAHSAVGTAIEGTIICARRCVTAIAYRFYCVEGIHSRLPSPFSSPGTVNIIYRVAGKSTIWVRKQC